MDWRDEERKKMLDDFNSGRISAEKLDEMSRVLDNLSISKKQRNVGAVLIKIAFILLFAVLVLVIVRSTTSFISYTLENVTVNNRVAMEAAFDKSGKRTQEKDNSAIIDYSFHELCKKGTMEQIRNAVKNKAKVNARDQDGNTPIMYAAKENPNRASLRALIQAGADVNARNNKNETPLMMAARYNSEPSITKLLISSEANVNAIDENGNTPLIIAALSDADIEVISLLRDNTPYTHKNKDGLTPLMMAARYTSNSKVITLLMRDYLIDEKDNDGYSALDYARVNDKIFDDKRFQRFISEMDNRID